MKSLASRIAFATALLTATVVAVCAAGAWFATSLILGRRLEESLVERERSVYQLLHQADIAPEGARLQLPRDFAEGGNSFIQLMDEDGREILRSPSLDPRHELISPAVTVDGDPAWIRMGSGHDVRVVARQIILSPSFVAVMPLSLVTDPKSIGRTSAAILWVGEDDSAYDRELRQLRWVLLVMSAVATVLAAAIAWWLRRAVMAPVDRLMTALAQVSVERTTNRIEIDIPTELLPIRTRINALLKEFEGVVGREKTTIANIAHELRTPISGLRTELEFAMVREPKGLDGDAVRRCLGITTSMQALVTNLLALARLEAGSVTVVPVEVDLEEVVDQAWDLVAHRAAARRIRLSLAAVLEDPVVRTCPDKSRVVMTNLFDNAVSHAPEGSLVTVSWSSDDRQLMLRLSNPIAKNLDTTRLFVPFWRAEESRTGGDGDHCGLGLALVARLMRLLGGRVSAEVENGKFMVEVAFPRRSGDRVEATSTKIEAIR